MKYALAKEHRDYFEQNQLVEFEELLTTQELLHLVNGVNGALARTLGVTVESLKNEIPGNLFMGGRDLWRTDAAVKKITAHVRLAKIASELIEHKPLRLGYAQYFPDPTYIYLNKEDKYEMLMAKELAIAELSCLQGVLCGVMICLEGEQSQEDADSEEPLPKGIFSAQAGNCVFFRPEKVIDFRMLKQRPGHSYLMIIYTHSTTVYVMNDQDPHLHMLKDIGYVYGDKLSDKSNPIVYR